MDSLGTKLVYGIDRFDLSVISGWARYNDKDEPVELELLVNDTPVGSIRAENYRHDLVKMRQDAKFAFRLEINLDSESMLACVPQEAEVYLRDAKSKVVLEKSRNTWAGLAPKGQKGIRNKAGQQYQLAKGKFVIPLKERDDAWKQRILLAAKKLAEEAHEGGFTLSAAYGTLLGGVRAQAMIPHDDDVDLMFLSNAGLMLEAVDELRALEAFLRTKGYKIDELSNGQIHVDVPGVGELPVDIFLGWFEKGRFNLTFTVHEGPLQSDILPLGTIVINDVELPAPNQPEPLLESIYGPSWKTPDPSFQWQRPVSIANYFAPIHNYKRTANVDYWQQYYAQRSQVSPPEYPSQFALFTMGLGKNPDLIVDMGCGSGRDSLFFGSQGFQVIGLDYADSAVADNSARALQKNLANKVSFMRCDVSNLGDISSTVKHISEERGDGPLCLYSRFFFHAIDQNTEGAALLLVSKLLSKEGDFAVFEFRTDKDADRQKVTPAHYRRYILVDQFIARAESLYSLKCTYRTEGLGYAVFRDDDAHVARLIFITPPKV